MTTQCNCEHARHPLPYPSPEADPMDVEAWEYFTFVAFPHIVRNGHEYMSVPAGSQNAQYVGPICDWCATHCMSEYLI
jgi:hypothetical protein